MPSGGGHIIKAGPDPKLKLDRRQLDTKDYSGLIKVVNAAVDVAVTY
jgi:hypothetical protein